MNADTNRFGFKYCQLYTVYFDKPVEVDSLFFMFGTFNNYGFADDLCVYLSHPPTVYTGATKYERNPAIACPYAFSTPQLIYSFHPDHDITLDLTGEGLLEFWGLFMPFIDFVNLHVLSADSSRGIAGPYDTVSKNTTQHIWARPYRGYHFTHWNDGDTNNPRDIRLMCDTTFVAYFDTNILYHVEVSSNRDWGGRVDGGGDYYENETAELRAVPLLSNYRFVHWSDGDTSNPRHVLVTQDTAFEAHFARDGEGIEQPEDGTPFSLSPNPTRDEVTVTADVMAGTVCRLT